MDQKGYVTVEELGLKRIASRPKVINTCGRDVVKLIRKGTKVGQPSMLDIRAKTYTGGAWRGRLWHNYSKDHEEIEKPSQEGRKEALTNAQQQAYRFWIDGVQGTSHTIWRAKGRYIRRMDARTKKVICLFFDHTDILLSLTRLTTPNLFPG